MMENSLSDFDNVFQRWGDTGKRKIPLNYAFFRELVRKARDLLTLGNLDAAGVYASIAASHAASHHCGIWASRELESVLRSIGDYLPTIPRRRAMTMSAPEPRKILHIASTVYAVSGHTRMLSRWIRADKTRQHSVVLTRQSTEEVPEFLCEAVSDAGGRIHLIDEEIGGLIKRARRLRRIAAEADLIVLHIHCDDVVPIIALATADRAPVIFLDHTDHTFWLGITVSDVIASMREAGKRLAIERRGADPARVTILPTIIEPAERTISRDCAKKKLGLAPNSILLCSVARAAKYRQISALNYADLHTSLLLQHKNAVLLVVGPGNQQDWTAAFSLTEGRIISLPEQPDPHLYFQAADIYLDSFPFVSITSVLEAGSYGTPAVSLFPYNDAAAILGCNMPGLDAYLVRCGRISEYEEQVSNLIIDGDHRQTLGRALRNKIVEEHSDGNWLSTLNNTYWLAHTLGRVSDTSTEVSKFFCDEPDVYLQAIFGVDTDPQSRSDRMLKFRLGLLPVGIRTREWWRLLRTSGMTRTSHFGPAVYLLPEWLVCRVGRFRRRSLRLTRRRPHQEEIGEQLTSA